MTRILLAGVSLAALATAASAGPLDALVGRLQARGLSHIEITVGPSQVKVEASGGGAEVEAVADIATRRVIEKEVGASDEDEAPGVEIGRSDEDFVDGDDEDDEDEDEDEDEGDEDEGEGGHHGGHDDRRARR